VGPDRPQPVTGPAQPLDDGTVAAVVRLADLAGKIERTDNALTRRIDELARDCAATQEQVDGLSGVIGTLTDQTEDIGQRLTEVTTLLGRMSAQITALAERPSELNDDAVSYRVNPPPPWWKPADQRCQDTADRLGDWVEDVYRPVFGYLADLLAPCWRQHPLCLAYLDVLHEAWCLLYLQHRDPKMVFAQLDWLTRSLLQAAEVMANETKSCHELNRHCEPGKDPAKLAAAPRLNTRR
jgi:hypothetical protein